MIYISEVHEIGSAIWTIPLAREKNIHQHVDINDRRIVARMMCVDRELKIPILVDDMDNSVAGRYSAFPSRFCLIDLDGRIAVTNRFGPKELGKVIGQAVSWLNKSRRSSRLAKPSITDE